MSSRSSAATSPSRPIVSPPSANSWATKSESSSSVKVNISAIKTFQYDQMDWYYAYVLKRVPRRPEMALHLGTLWHTLLETYTKTADKDAAKEAARKSVADTISQLSIEP